MLGTPGFRGSLTGVFMGKMFASTTSVPAFAALDCAFVPNTFLDSSANMDPAEAGDKPADGPSPNKPEDFCGC